MHTLYPQCRNDALYNLAVPSTGWHPRGGGHERQGDNDGQE